MSVDQTIKRYTRIISLLRRRPMDYDEIQNEMSLDPDAIEDKLLTSQRTLQRDIKAIASIYDIEIVADKSYNKYYIKEDVEDLQSRRLRESFEVVNAIKMTKGLGNTLVFEERSSLGTEHMAGLIHAIQNNLIIEFSYQKYWNNSESKRMVKPISLKEARNRWYLIAQDEKDSKVKNFSLDRIHNLSITPSKFKSVSFDVNMEFKDCFGIINGSDEEPIEVILSFTLEQGRYIQSLPLHHSQQIINENSDEIRFRYYIKPTHDFKMEVLSYGDQVRVVSPETLQNQIKDQLKKALNRY
ncbi:MAG: WYL domain-containing protein [Flavobacteriaceae bacterium]|nr:WYL domain-containing protein [Flavobacteriaceae bacterium]